MSYLYPYGDTQQLNLSWFLAKFKELYEYITNLDPDDIALATVLSRFTNEYNSSTNYIPGDYVIHEGFIYKANQSTTGNFNPQAWDAALPVNDIQGLRILLGGMSTDLTALEQNAITNVQYTPGAASADGLLRQTKNGTAETVMTVDKEPTANSQNPVKSGAVQAGIAAVSQAVGSERTDRQNADTSLQDQITSLNSSKADKRATAITSLSQLGDDSLFFVATDNIAIGDTGVTISQYSRGVFINFNSNEAGLLAVTIDGDLIWAYRVSGTWTKADSSANVYTTITNSNPFLERTANATDVDLTANSYTQLTTLTIEAGTWVINAYTWLSDTGTDYYNSNISTNYGNSTCIFPAYNGGSNSNTMIVTFPTTQTIAVNVFYARAIKASCAVKAFRINK